MENDMQKKAPSVKYPPAQTKLSSLTPFPNALLISRLTEKVALSHFD